MTILQYYWFVLTLKWQYLWAIVGVSLHPKLLMKAHSMVVSNHELLKQCFTFKSPFQDFVKWLLEVKWKFKFYSLEKQRMSSYILCQVRLFKKKLSKHCSIQGRWWVQSSTLNTENKLKWSISTDSKQKWCIHGW